MTDQERQSAGPAAATIQEAETRLDPLRSAALSALPWLRHSFSTRMGGVSQVYGRLDDLNLGLTHEDDPTLVAENRRRLVEATGETETNAWTLSTARQTHSTRTVILTEDDPQPREPADGLMTDVAGMFVAVLTADCVPVLVVDTRRRVVGAFHAGWRGTAARIVEHGVDIFRSKFGSDPQDLLAAVGPSIGPCCYQVGEEVHTAFHHHFPYAPSLFYDSRLNLWEANRRQLQAAGIPPAQISLLQQCTACTCLEETPRFFSHRADRGVTGRMMALVGVAPEIATPVFPIT